MAYRKQLTWTELRVGIFVLVGLFVLGAGIFYVTAPGILGPKYQLKTFLPEVAQLSNGAPVRLDGVEVGILKEAMGFRRFSLRGQIKANLEWTLVCLAYKLRRLHRVITARQPAIQPAF
jgi:hypothetical protein